MAQKDENFNEFLRNFKAKNEQGWGNIIDLTQEQQEEKLLEITPEMRKNQMIMMEEFRRRKNLNDYYDLMKVGQQQGSSSVKQDELGPFDMTKASMAQAHQYHGSNAERYFEPRRDEVFNPNDFTLIFMASDSVTNVTSLNRVNSRRVLIFVGNGNGLVSYGKGKAEEYE